MDKKIITVIIISITILLLFGYDTATDSIFFDTEIVYSFMCQVPILILNELTQSDLQEVEFVTILKERYSCE